MNKIMKKIYLSVLTLGITVVALGTTTFAWFTLTNQADIQSFEAQVIADAGIEMRLAKFIAVGETGDRFGASFPETRWVTTLTTTMLQDFIEEVFTEDFRFNERTSSDGSTIRLNDASKTAASDGFLEFELDFRSNAATTILWTGAGLTSQGVPFTTSVDFTDADGTEYEVGDFIGNRFASHATRISVEQRTGQEATDHLVVYELPAGDGNIVLGGFETTDPNADPTEFELAFPNGALSYYFAVMEEMPLNVDTVVVPETITDFTADQVVLEMDENHLDIDNFEYSGTITVRIWLEGWDPNMFNVILNDIISVSLEFGVQED